ncbi:GNAT family N-acetyltransferase [Paractinoplanes durhamensis]|uniref:N-acetyltransferase n=1 Tax=Paractinoplanes durhamensis TaxID=113563 RepID=A0ABQ3Z919_9ACTN|nr:GNAT family N-acetyltransferase [Actinoplanes durhamensis]GIE06316.1 N-acetyltransferase [Actinoplanes durhamensis]
MSEIEVRDNAQQHRFELLVDGAMAGMAAYRLRDGAVVITHSEVDRQFRGQGLGNELAQRTLDLLRSRGDKVVPVCPFFARYVEEHPTYDDIIVS